MISKKDIEIIKRYSEGNLADTEIASVYSIFADNEDNPDFEHQLQKEFNDYVKHHPQVNINLSHVLDRIHHDIRKREFKAKQSLSRKIYRWYSLAAAILIIPLLIGGAIWVMHSQQPELVIAEKPVESKIIAPLGSRINFTLPDGTEGWLNSGSSLSYQIPFNHNRQLKLTGEAWFSVVKDEEHPFEIHAANSKVKVLGTKFNMNAYPEEKYVEVVLEEGKVAFNAPGMVGAVELKPDERLVYTSDSINIATTEPYKYSSWKEGKLIFRGDPMTEVARRIERWYNVEVELVDQELENNVIRGIFQDDSLNEVCKYLAMTSPIRYRILERKVLDDGTFQKTRVLFYQKNL